MAYMLGLPMLVIKERSVKGEGMLDRYDWYVQDIDVTPTLIDQKEFLGTFESWRRKVAAPRLFG
jgi:hypothetical protein